MKWDRRETAAGAADANPFLEQPRYNSSLRTFQQQRREIAGDCLNAKTWLVLGACFGALAVGLGAFGAHGLPWYFDQLDVPVGDVLRKKGLENWETASRYHMYHALAMLAVGVLADRRRLWQLDAAGIAFFFGTLLFSGSLYALVLTDARKLGAVVPIGGVLFIVGWVLLAIAGSKFVAEQPGDGKQSLRERAQAELQATPPATADDAPAATADDAPAGD